MVYALLFCAQSMTQIQSITIYKHRVVLKTLIRITYRDVHYININHGGNKFCLFLIFTLANTNESPLTCLYSAITTDALL